MKRAARYIALCAAISLSLLPMVAVAQEPEPVPTPAPAPSLSVLTSSDTSLSIRWSVYETYEYEIRWRPNGSTEWTTRPAWSVYYIRDLTADTLYDVQARGRRVVVGDTPLAWSLWSTTLEARTQPTTVPTPLPEPYRLAYPIDTISIEGLLAFGFQSGDVLVVGRYTVTPPEQLDLPPIGDVVRWRIDFPASSENIVRQELVYVTPGTVEGSGLGWGRGLLLARCHCYPSGMSDDQWTAEESLNWTITTQVNAARVRGQARSVTTTFSLVRLPTRLDQAPAQAVAVALNDIDRTRGTQTIVDGRVTQLGNSYIESYVPGAQFLLPSLYYRVPVQLDRTPIAGVTMDGAQPIGGDIVTKGLGGVATLTGISAEAAGGIVVLALMIGAYWLGTKTPVPYAGAALAVIPLLLGISLGFVGVWTGAIVALGAAAVIVWVLFLRKG